MPTAPKPRREHAPGCAANMEGVAAVGRAISIVEAMANAGEPRTLSELAADTGLYKSTLLRLARHAGATAGRLRRPQDGSASPWQG